MFSPAFDGVRLSSQRRNLWDRFYTDAPRSRTPYEASYSDRKLRSRTSRSGRDQRKDGDQVALSPVGGRPQWGQRKAAALSFRLWKRLPLQPCVCRPGFRSTMSHCPQGRHPPSDAEQALRHIPLPKADREKPKAFKTYPIRFWPSGNQSRASPLHFPPEMHLLETSSHWTDSTHSIKWDTSFRLANR